MAGVVLVRASYAAGLSHKTPGKAQRWQDSCIHQIVSVACSHPAKGRREMKNNPGLVIFGVVVGMWLLSNPRCKRGCRTVAEHLITHGIDEFLAGL